MTKLSPGQEYLTPFHRCEWREGEGRGGGGDQRRSELGLVMHIQNGARSVARALPFAPSARAYVFVSGPASDGRMSLSYLISPYLIFEQAVIIRCKDGLASDGSISGEGRGYGRRGTTTFETESELSRDQNVKVQLGKGGQTLLPRLAAHPPLALCAYLYIRTCMRGRPIILFSSLILFQIHFDRFPTCFPSSTRK